MEEKKIKIEISKLALVFIILFSLSLLVWSFVIGVWVGIKIGSKSKKEEIALEQPTMPQESISTQPSILNETVAPPSPVKITPSVKKESTKKESTKKRTLIEHKKLPKYQKKEVAKIASQIKKPVSLFYSLQIGAFSKKESAKKLKNIAKAKGYEAFIKESKLNGKILYKVCIGKYSTVTEAKKHISQITKDLKVKKPFVIKIK